MEKVFRVETSAAPGELFDIVSDLSNFPQWIEVVNRVDPAEPAETMDVDGGPSAVVEPTWWVVLRAQIGPLARSKRLRMRRAVCSPPTAEEPGIVRFERAETDGRDHAEWTMEVEVGTIESVPEVAGASGNRSWAQCRLFYGGAMWTMLLEGQLDAVADRATARLKSLAAA